MSRDRMSGFAILLLSWSSLLLQGHHVQAADKAYVRSKMTELFSDTRYHSPEHSAHKAVVRDAVYTELKSFGLETDFHNFTVPEYAVNTVFHNIVGVLRGQRFGTADDEIIGIGAHYDTVERTKGVDDNGSGVTGVLEAARQITEQNKKGVMRNNTIIFMVFDLEEYKLGKGSSLFITEWIEPWLVRNYGYAAPQLRPHGVFILEMLLEFNTTENSQMLPGDPNLLNMVFPDLMKSVSSDNFQGDFMAVIYRNATADTVLAQTFREMWLKQSRPEMQIELAGLPPLTESSKMMLRHFLRSDHKSFWEDNIPAVQITDTSEFRGDLIDCYHKPCDNLEVMLTDENLDFMIKAIDSLVAAVDKLSDRTSNEKTSGASGFHRSLVLLVLMKLVAYMI